jgi:site-specific DNA-methyltransferase (adenine-specific)
MKGYKQLMSSNTQSWCTPDWLYNKLDSEFHFTLDPCATEENAKCYTYFTINENGLTESWKDHIAYINPPYNEQDLWITKSYNELLTNNVTSVLLIPARPDKKIWFDLIGPNASQVRFLKGRIKFVGAQHGSTFPSCLVIFTPHRYSERFIFVDYR